MPNNIGYIINDTILENTSMVIKEHTQTGAPIAEVILQDMECDNRNRRYYAKKDLLPELSSERTLELLSTGNFKGENGHPMSADVKRQSTIDPNNVCVKYLKIWTEGNDIKALCTGTNNQLGQEFNADLLSGEKPSFSLRALGSIENKNGHAYVKNIKIITWDRVYYPSHKRAYTQGLVQESALYGTNDSKIFVDKSYHGMLIPITNNDIIQQIKQESVNLSQIIDTFGSLYENVQILNNGRNIQLTDRTGTTLIVNLEDHVQDMIMNYCSRR